MKTAPFYPDSDGNPIADNTLQFQWIVTIKENLAHLFADRADVFVAGDLLWYAVEGDPTIRQAPDAMVAFGRPKGYRGSYMQWVEDGIAPQVVFEVLSPGNRRGEMTRKAEFYRRYGVQEYYIYDPDDGELEGFMRQGDLLQGIPDMNGWVSPRLGIRFDTSGPELRIWRPDDQSFLTFGELATEREKEKREKELAQHEKELAQHEKELAQREKELAQHEVQRLLALLKSKGIDPDA